MTSDEEIVLEQYIKSQNMDKKNRDFYLNLILNSKELTDSEYNFRDESPSSYDVVFLCLNDEGSIVRFDGAISNGEENKLYYGAIIKKGNKYVVCANVYRLFELVFGDDKEYSVFDEFRFKDDRVLRRTTYRDRRHFESEVTLKTTEEMEEYYKGKIGKIRKR